MTVQFLTTFGVEKLRDRFPKLFKFHDSALFPILETMAHLFIIELKNNAEDYGIVHQRSKCMTNQGAMAHVNTVHIYTMGSGDIVKMCVYKSDINASNDDNEDEEEYCWAANHITFEGDERAVNKFYKEVFQKFVDGLDLKSLVYAAAEELKRLNTRPTLEMTNLYIHKIF